MGLRPVNRRFLGHCLFIMLLSLLGANAQAGDFWRDIRTEITRKPANYVPDDDVIVVPIIYNDNIFTKMKEDNSSNIQRTRTQIREIQERREFETAWGLEDRGIFNYPTQEERIEFFQRTYLRYLSKQAERSVTQDVERSVRGAWRDWTARDEVETIEASKENSDFIAENKESKIAKNLTVNKDIKTSKKSKIKFSFQPRIEQGLVKMGLRNDYIDATAWVGVNNTQELRVEHSLKEIGFSALANYYVHKNELLLSLNQVLIPHVTAHYTYREAVANEVVDGEEQNTASTNGNLKTVETIFQIRFGMAF